MADDVLFEIRQIAKRKFDTSKVDLLINELYPGKDLDVPDPWSGPEEEYHEAFKLIDAACETIIEKAYKDQGSRTRNQQLSNKQQWQKLTLAYHKAQGILDRK